MVVLLNIKRAHTPENNVYHLGKTKHTIKYHFSVRVLIMPVTQLDDLREKLKQLRIEHRQLDAQIEEETHNKQSNSLELQRLKKRKLAFKDTIVKLESQLIPDLNA